MLSRYLVQALAVSGLAFAQSSNRCGDVTIENQEDAAGLSSCSKIKGDVKISDKFSGNLVLEGVESISGDLKSNGADKVQSISAPQLEIIEGALDLNGLVEMRELRMDSLTEVGSITLIALPNLNALGFGSTVTKAGRVRIENTDLRSLDGIDLESTEGMQILNNNRLATVNVNNIVNATGLINFSANSEKLKIQFPNLETAQNMTFRNATSVEIPSLKKTAGLLGFYSNTLEDFSAPNLTETGDLVFVDNSKLSNISLPVLETVNGALQIANNTKLETIDGFDSLTLIDGTLDFTGKFTEIKLPKLEEIKGEFNIQSSKELPDCEDKLADLSKATEAEFTCKGKVKDPKSLDPSRSGGDDDDEDDENAAAIANPPAIMAMMALVGGAVQLVL